MSIDGLSIGVCCGNASAREGTRNSARLVSRLASLCLQTSGLSPSPIFAVSTSLRIPFGLFSRPSGHYLTASSPPISLRVSLRTPPPCPFRAKKSPVSHSLSLCVVSPHYRPLPSRPLRFKSPCSGGGREDVNFTWHGNVSATAMFNREMMLFISETRSEISRREP